MKNLGTITFYKRMAVISTTLCLVCMSFIFISANKMIPAPGKLESINATTANTYVANYMNTATATNTVIKATLVDVDQLNAMTIIRRDVPSANSFRLYFAKDNTGLDASVIVGVDATGKDIESAIYVTSRFTSGVCPPVCDNASHINSDN